MAARKDSKGYALRKGESQRKSDGRYVFTWTDKRGDRHYKYAGTLAELREQERVIKRDIEDGIDPLKAARITVNDMYDKYMASRPDLKQTTKNNYTY